MARAEREEYFFLMRRGRWTSETVKRLRELREWKDRTQVPNEYRAVPRTSCGECDSVFPPGWYADLCDECELGVRGQ